MSNRPLPTPLPPRSSNAHLAEAGCDEAGRGCLAGPVYAAAVILPPDFSHPWLNDSKQLSERRREELRPIIEAEAVAWAVASVSAEEIDRIMHQNIDQLNHDLPAYSKVSSMRIFHEEFEKTSKRSVKRYLYQPSGR